MSENFYNIDKDKNYFIRMRPLEFVPLLGVAFTSSSTKEKWVECKIVEDRYKIEDGYKVTLQAIEDGYGREHFYQSDFVSSIKSGHILPKTSEDQKCKLYECGELIANNVLIKHSGYIVE